LGKRLKRARLDAKLTQAQAAQLLGVEQSIISRIETAERDVTVAELMALAEVYGKPPSQFLDPDLLVKVRVVEVADD
jgi:transcriptional regulator with XRE-family HTH domain